MSAASSMASIFDGLTDGDLVEIRNQRTSLGEDYAALMSEYARLNAMDPDSLEDHAGEFDAFRHAWFKKVAAFVKLV